MENKKARMKRAQRMALRNCNGDKRMFTAAYRDCRLPEGQSRDKTTVFAEDDPLCAALDNLFMLADIWRETLKNPWQREDKAYRKMLAENLRSKLREVTADEPGKES